MHKETIGQYTGLQDKNGKEIYEGDILKIHYIGEIGTAVHEVLFYNGTFAVSCTKDYKSLLNEVNEYSEIIGNIYENSDLLEN